MLRTTQATLCKVQYHQPQKLGIESEWPRIGALEGIHPRLENSESKPQQSGTLSTLDLGCRPPGGSDGTMPTAGITFSPGRGITFTLCFFEEVPSCCDFSKPLKDCSSLENGPTQLLKEKARDCHGCLLILPQLVFTEESPGALTKLQSLCPSHPRVLPLTQWETWS